MTEKTNIAFVTRVCLVATLGGMLFGYDTGVIAGAIGFLQEYFQLSSTMKGWAASSALLGCVVGVAIGGVVSDYTGRKKTQFFACFNGRPGKDDAIDSFILEKGESHSHG